MRDVWSREANARRRAALVVAPPETVADREIADYHGLVPDEFDRTITHAERPTDLKLRAIAIIDGVAVTYHLSALQDRISIGRYTGSTINIDHHSLSRLHAILRPGPSMTIEDLGSANGTYVREVRIRPGKHVPVTTGDVIRLGGVLLLLRDD